MEPIEKKYCEFCGKELPDDAEKITDPYGEEICDDFTLYWMCDDCAYESAMEI